jgi:hypothetical protein
MESVEDVFATWLGPAGQPTSSMSAWEPRYD